MGVELFNDYLIILISSRFYYYYTIYIVIIYGYNNIYGSILCYQYIIEKYFLKFICRF